MIGGGLVGVVIGKYINANRDGIYEGLWATFGAKTCRMLLTPTPQLAYKEMKETAEADVDPSDAEGLKKKCEALVNLG